jgi:hypothetical protein
MSSNLSLLFRATRMQHYTPGRMPYSGPQMPLGNMRANGVRARAGRTAH